jgi:uncharacterized phage protein (TIGR02216 family)
MQFGLGILKLSPDAFWRMTPKELGAAIEGAQGRTNTLSPLSRQRLDELTASFPDKIFAPKERPDAR